MTPHKTMTPKELKQYADACRKAGITHLKIGDVEMTIDLSSTLQSKRQPDVKEAEDKPQYTDEEALLWSVNNA